MLIDSRRSTCPTILQQNCKIKKIIRYDTFHQNYPDLSQTPPPTQYSQKYRTKIVRTAISDPICNQSHERQVTKVKNHPDQPFLFLGRVKTNEGRAGKDNVS